MRAEFRPYRCTHMSCKHRCRCFVDDGDAEIGIGMGQSNVSTSANQM